MVFVSAESCWHHRYAAGRTDWRTVIPLHQVAPSLDAPATRRESDGAGTMSVSSLRLWAKRDTTTLDIRRRPQLPLGGDHFVHRKLFDVGWPFRLDARRRHSLGKPRGKSIEVLPRLPKIDDPPPTVDWPGCVEEEALRRRALAVDLVVHTVELLLRDSCEFDADANGHAASPSLGSPTLRRHRRKSDRREFAHARVRPLCPPPSQVTTVSPGPGFGNDP